MSDETPISQQALLNLDDYRPKEESLESLKESEEIIADGTSRFENVDNTLAALKA